MNRNGKYLKNLELDFDPAFEISYFYTFCFIFVLNDFDYGPKFQFSRLRTSLLCGREKNLRLGLFGLFEYARIAIAAEGLLFDQKIKGRRPEAIA